MAASMEMRVPFLENDLIDFGLHLPRRAKLHRNIGKWLVKQAATEVLPPDVVYARKKGFPFPTAYAMGTERLLAGGMLAEFMRWPAVNTEEIAELARGDGGLLFHVVGLELWFRLHFRRRDPGSAWRGAHGRGRRRHADACEHVAAQAQGGGTLMRLRAP